MKHYINASGEVFGFEIDGSQDEYINPELIPLSEDQMKEYENKPSIYHEFNLKSMSWQISKSMQKKAEIDTVVTLKIKYNNDIIPLQYALDLGDISGSELILLESLKKKIVALSRWRAGEKIPT